MALPWVRLDSNVYSHDKVLALLAEKDGYRAFTAYTFSLAYAGGHGTDGLIAKHVLPIVHATPRIAEQLVEHRLWEHAGGGAYLIRNWEQRQELAFVTEAKRQTRSLAGRKSQCLRNHGPDCGCWQQQQTA